MWRIGGDKMQISDEIIKVLEYMCDKVGVTIDWTSNNVLPYVQKLGEKFIRWEIGTSISWIVISIISVVVTLLIVKFADMDGLERLIFATVIILATIIIGCQIFDIIKCYTFPEKAIYDYIQEYLRMNS